jgi:hypothetical protein
MIVFVISAMSSVACSQVAWSGKYVAGPAMRRHASEERAKQAIDAYFDAARDLIGLSQVRIHDDCIDAYWRKGPMTAARRRRITSDKVCSLVLDRFDECGKNLAGYGKSPSGKYPWLGEVFEYVVRTESVQSKEEKMASLDRYTIKGFEELLSQHASPVIPNVAADYFVMRGTCCRDVTIFDDWYKTRFKQQISAK